jgi:ribosomal protein S28E/S33
VRQINNVLDGGETYAIAGDVLKIKVRSASGDLEVRTNKGDVFPVREGDLVALGEMSQGLTVKNLSDLENSFELILMAGASASYESSAGAVEVVNFPDSNPSFTTRAFQVWNAGGVVVDVFNTVPYRQLGDSGRFYFVPTVSNRKSIKLDLGGANTVEHAFFNLDDANVPTDRAAASKTLSNQTKQMMAIYKGGETLTVNGPTGFVLYCSSSNTGMRVVEELYV